MFEQILKSHILKSMPNVLNIKPKIFPFLIQLFNFVRQSHLTWGHTSIRPIALRLAIIRMRDGFNPRFRQIRSIWNPFLTTRSLSVIFLSRFLFTVLRHHRWIHHSYIFRVLFFLDFFCFSFFSLFCSYEAWAEAFLQRGYGLADVAIIL